MTKGERYRVYFNGFEDSLELCLFVVDKAETKEAAAKEISQYLGSIKADKIRRFKDDLTVVPGKLMITITEEKDDEKKD